MSGRAEKLTPKQAAALAALVTEPTHADAAAKAGVSEATLYRWLRLPKFRATYLEVRRRLVEGVVTRLQQLATDALESLHRNLRCGKPSAEIRAAAYIVDRIFSGMELLDLAERVAQLESAFGGKPRDAKNTNSTTRRNGTADYPDRRA
jgi:hypothetical protein